MSDNPDQTARQAAQDRLAAETIAQRLLQETTMSVTLSPPAAAPAAAPVATHPAMLTGAVSLSTASLANVVVWLSNGAHQPMPPDVTLAAVALLMPALHLAYLLLGRLAIRLGVDPSTV